MPQKSEPPPRASTFSARKTSAVAVARCRAMTTFWITPKLGASARYWNRPATPSSTAAWRHCACRRAARYSGVASSSPAAGTSA